MKSNRIATALAASGLLQACAAVEDKFWDSATACGPEVSRNSVRVVDARDAFAAGGVQAAIERAESSTGLLKMLDLDLHRTTHYAALKGNGAKRGCDVVIHVRTQKNVENSGWDAHFVLLARRVANSVE